MTQRVELGYLAARFVAAVFVGLLIGLGSGGCDDSVRPRPPKQGNLAPETFLAFQGDSLRTHFYKLRLSWLGTDADGRVTGYRRRFVCLPGAVSCPLDTSWVTTSNTTEDLLVPVPNDSAQYQFEVAAVDDDGVPDPTPASQVYKFFNSAPVAGFESGTLPQTSLPAITFYLTAADPDTTPEPDDHDSEANLSRWRVWLDGSEAAARWVPLEERSITFRAADFEGRLDTLRTIFVQAYDDGEAASPPKSHTWTVESAPANGILLVDDCRMGGNLEVTSDRSYRNVLSANARDRFRVLDIENVPRLTQDDLDATLSLFDQVIWYTDADNASSGALELASAALLALLEQRAGRLLVVSGLVFGTDGAWGEQEARFRQLFGIDSLFTGPSGTTNFTYSRQDTIEARVHPGRTQVWMLSQGNPGLGIMDCFRSRSSDATTTTRSIYFFPEGKLIRPGFVNKGQYDIGVYHETEFGGRTAYASFPLGLPLISNTGINEVEIHELLKLLGMLDP